MPMFLNGERPTVRIDLPTPGEWVEVHPQLSAGERRRLTSAGVEQHLRLKNGMRALESEVDIDTDALLDAVAFRALEIGIVSWSFPVPVTPEAIRALDEHSHDYVTKRLDALWKARTDDDRGNSGELGAAPSAAVDAHHASSPGSR